MAALKPRCPARRHGAGWRAAGVRPAQRQPRADRGPESWVLHAAPDITEPFLDHPKEAVVEAWRRWPILDTSLPRVIFARALR